MHPLCVCVSFLWQGERGEQSNLARCVLNSFSTDRSRLRKQRVTCHIHWMDSSTVEVPLKCLLYRSAKVQMIYQAFGYFWVSTESPRIEVVKASLEGTSVVPLLCSTTQYKHRRRTTHRHRQHTHHTHVSFLQGAPLRIRASQLTGRGSDLAFKVPHSHGGASTWQLFGWLPFNLQMCPSESTIPYGAAPVSG